MQQSLLNTVGRRLRAATFRKRLRALSRRLGIDIRMVQSLLGHANLRTTEIYVKVSNHALRRALERADVLDALEQ